MRTTWSRTALLHAGAASSRAYLRAARQSTRSARQSARIAFAEHAEAVPWPAKRTLQIHLALSVLPAAAVHTALQREGHSSTESTRITRDAVVALALPLRRLTRLVASTRPGRRLFMRAAAGSLRAFPEPGWRATWHQRTPDRVAFDMTRCYDLDTLRELDAAAIAPSFCAVDDALYAGLHPELLWQRTRTLATRGTHCDFCFVHGPASPETVTTPRTNVANPTPRRNRPSDESRSPSL